MQNASLSPGTKINSFEIIRTVGVRGFGMTCAAYDEDFGRTVALREYCPLGVGACARRPYLGPSTEDQDGTYE